MITISPGKLPAWLKDMGERAHATVLAGVRSAAQLARSEMVRRTDRAKPYPAVDRGTLRGRWAVRNTPVGAVLSNDSPHAPMIEYGVRPGRIPGPDKGGGITHPAKWIVGWVMRKFRMSSDDAFPIAIAVQRKLHQRGIAGRRIMSSPAALREMQRLVTQEVKIRLARLKAS